MRPVPKDVREKAQRLRDLEDEIRHAEDELDSLQSERSFLERELSALKGDDLGYCGFCAAPAGALEPFCAKCGYPLEDVPELFAQYFYERDGERASESLRREYPWLGAGTAREMVHDWGRLGVKA